MTFYKTLKSATVGDREVTAYEYTEKYATAPGYQIVISENGLGYEVIPAARTTWKRKFNQALQELKR